MNSTVTEEKMQIKCFLQRVDERVRTNFKNSSQIFCDGFLKKWERERAKSNFF